MSFTCTYQLSTHSRREFREYGPVNEEQFVKLFKDFAWEEEIAQAAAFRKGTPTLSVIDEKGGELSISGTVSKEGELEYTVNIVHDRPRSLLGIIHWRSSERRHCLATDPRVVEGIIEQFFNSHWEALRKLMRK